MVTMAGVGGKALVEGFCKFTRRDAPLLVCSCTPRPPGSDPTITPPPAGQGVADTYRHLPPPPPTETPPPWWPLAASLITPRSS